jgi:putative hydroxymethylpyrimidine transport system substrate-binding protein
VDELGIPTYDELVLVASEERLAEDPGEVRDFLAALERGTAAAAEDPELATAAVLEAGEGLDPDLTAAEVEATLPFLAPDGGRFGYMDPAEWEEFAAFMVDEGQVGTAFAPADVSTNEYLPGDEN